MLLKHLLFSSFESRFPLLSLVLNLRVQSTLEYPIELVKPQHVPEIQMYVLYE